MSAIPARSTLWNSVKFALQRNLIEGVYTDIFGNSTVAYQAGAISQEPAVPNESYPDYDIPEVQAPEPSEETLPAKKSRFHAFFKEDYSVDKPYDVFGEPPRLQPEICHDYESCLDIPTTSLDDCIKAEASVELLNPEDFTYGLNRPQTALPTPFLDYEADFFYGCFNKNPPSSTSSNSSSLDCSNSSSKSSTTTNSSVGTPENLSEPTTPKSKPNSYFETFKPVETPERTALNEYWTWVLNRMEDQAGNGW